ncbi:MAG TPA: hypothetical protein ENK02_11045 [Planctomycetes bacterium]|nr:hypothetical protein [Planctomycetota bacterium]
MRFLLGLLLSLIAACGLLVAGLALLSTWRGPKKPTVPEAPPILLPATVRASIQQLPPLTPPAKIPESPLGKASPTKKLLPFEAHLSRQKAQHLILTSLPPAPLEIQVLNASDGTFSGRLQEACYQVRGFSETWGRLFTVDRFCMSPGARLDLNPSKESGKTESGKAESDKAEPGKAEPQKAKKVR